MTKLISVHIDGKAYLRPENPYLRSNVTPKAGMNNFESHRDFEQSVKPIICLFEIAEGETVDESEVELVWQERTKFEACDEPDDYKWRTVGMCKRPTGPLDDTRQAYKLKHPLPPGSDVKNEIHVIDLSEFCINMSDVERAFCFGYLSNPDNNCLDNVEMMKRWNNFKDNYLEPRYGQ